MRWENPYLYPKPPYAVGDRFIMRTKQHKIYHKNDYCHVQRKHRKYLCKVVEIMHEQYNDSFGTRKTRCKCLVKVVSIP